MRSRARVHVFCGAKKLPCAYGCGHANGKGNGKDYARIVDGDLMACNDSCAQGSQKKGREGKGRDLYAEGYGIGEAYAYYCGNERQIKAFSFYGYPVLSKEELQQKN